MVFPGDVGDVVNGGGGDDTIGGGGDDGSGGGNSGGTATTASVQQSIRAQWNDGSTNDISITNTGTGTANGWTIEFDADFDITTVWNADLISHTGNHYVIKSKANFWNAKILPGKSISAAFGFNTFLSPGDSTAIQNVMFNGKPA